MSGVGDANTTLIQQSKQRSKMRDIDALIKRARGNEYGPHYTCDCDNGRKGGIVKKCCPKCGEPSEMVPGGVYISLHVSATWTTVSVPIEEFREWINSPNVEVTGR